MPNEIFPSDHFSISADLILGWDKLKDNIKNIIFILHKIKNILL
jgi:hypothetical protein